TEYPFPDAARAIPSPATRWDVSPRVDMMLGAKNTMTTSYEYEAGTNSTNPPVSSALLAPSSSSSSDQEVQISDTQLWSSKIINETRFEYERSTSNSLTPGTSPGIGVSGGFGVASGSQANSTGDHEEFQNYTSIQLTNNFIRFGGRLVSGGESNYSNGGSYGSLSYDYLLDPCTDPNLSSRPSNCLATPVAPACSTANMAPIPNTTPVQYYPLYPSYQCGIAYSFGIKDIEPYGYTISARETDVGFYAEDDWKVKSNLTLSYGIR